MEQEEDRNPGETPEQTAPDRIVHPVRRPVPGVLRCPQCGSTRIRRRTTPFLFNLAACAVCIPMTVLLCAMVIGVLVSLLALPVTACIAIVGRHRCLDCRHRFEPGYETTSATVSLRFPWRFHVLNVLMLLLLCLVGPQAMRFVAGGGSLPDMMTDAGIFMILGLLLWGSLAFHLVLYHLLRRKVGSPVVWAALFLVPSVLGGGTVFYESRPSLRVRALLQFAQLAPLPESATGVRIYSWSSPFSGEDYLRFTADAKDIDRFLAESPALQGQEPERFSAERMRLKHTRGSMRTMPDANGGHEYFMPDPTAPSWYKQEIEGPARRYIIQPPRYQFPGHVLVDDETNTVYIDLCFS